MVWARFGCCEDPFRGAFDERFVYPASNQEVLFAQLLANVPESGSVSLLTAPPGTGKTMLLYRLADQLRRSLLRVAVFPTPLTSIASLASTCGGVERNGDDEGSQDPTLSCQQLLLSSASEPRWILLFDEAQALTDEVLGFLFDLTQLSGVSGRAPSILLSGQALLKDRLKEWSVARGVDAFWTHYRLAPFQASEVAALIRHRMRAAGCRRLDVCCPDAVEALTQYSEANPGRVLALLNLALFLAEEAGEAKISPEAVKRAASAMLLAGEPPVETGSSPIPVPSKESTCDHESSPVWSQRLNETATSTAERPSNDSELKPGDNRRLRTENEARETRRKTPGLQRYRLRAISLLGLGIAVGLGWLVVDQRKPPRPEVGTDLGPAVTPEGITRSSPNSRLVEVDDDSVAMQMATGEADRSPSATVVGARPLEIADVAALTVSNIEAGNEAGVSGDEPDDTSQPLSEPDTDEQILVSTEVRLLLSMAEAHLEADRLVAPRFNNALYAYRKVLRIDPGNQEVQSGLRAIRAKLRRFAKEERARGNELGAQRQLNKLSLLEGLE